MPSSCSVEGCWPSLARKHVFPNPVKDLARFQAWVKLCGKGIAEISVEKVHRNHRVCSHHFKSRDFGPNQKLKRSAIPSVNLPGSLMEPVCVSTEFEIHDIEPEAASTCANIEVEREAKAGSSNAEKELNQTSIMQYVVVRGDLLKELKWPIGALIAQACHAVTAITHMCYEDEQTKLYLNDMDNMHKIVLEALDEQSIISLHNKLEENSVKHKLWIEQPENIPTCIAVKPYPKEEIQKYFKKYKLFKM